MKKLLAIIFCSSSVSISSSTSVKKCGEEIEAKYEIEQDNQDTLILGTDFSGLKKISIFLNDKEIKKSQIKNNKYLFKKKGNYKTKPRKIFRLKIIR